MQVGRKLAATVALGLVLSGLLAAPASARRDRTGDARSVRPQGRLRRGQAPQREGVPLRVRSPRRGLGRRRHRRRRRAEAGPPPCRDPMPTATGCWTATTTATTTASPTRTRTTAGSGAALGRTTTGTATDWPTRTRTASPRTGARPAARTTTTTVAVRASRARPVLAGENAYGVAVSGTARLRRSHQVPTRRPKPRASAPPAASSQ
jgi:hypothetical protein